MAHSDFLPAMGHGPLWLYDPLTRLLGVSRAHRRLLAHARIALRMRVLDIGCGTGNLTLLARREGGRVTALDPDPEALARAAAKAARAGLDVQFDQGFAERLPYPDASFDRVLSAFMYHHVRPPARAAMLNEIRRVLRPGGALFLADFAFVEAPELTRLERRGPVAYFRT
jgi:ubiquinone/menaquinone biosynthesis C-methylase UbiE